VRLDLAPNLLDDLGVPGFLLETPEAIDFRKAKYRMLTQQTEQTEDLGGLLLR
jgi:hypothetical protein